MAKVATPFSPMTHGFAFANYFKIDFPIKFPLPFMGKLDLSEVIFGLCGGMCAASLDYFYAGEVIPYVERPDSIDQKLFTYLCERQLQSLSIPVVLKIIEWMMLEDSELITRMIRVEIPKIRRSLVQGNPVILCLIRAKGLNNPTMNHQVVVTGYDLTLDGKAIHLSLYEPNHPGEEISITAGLSRPDFSITQSSGEPLRGFFTIPYTRLETFPRPAAPELISFGSPDGFTLQWPVDSRVCTQRFDEHPEWYKGFGLPGHEGLDLLALDGASIRACAEGEVFEAGLRKDHPYGVQVRIRHRWGNQEYHTIYAHLSRTTVIPGQKVTAGQEIGKADSTGNSTGSHLHLTLKKIGARTGKYPPDIIDPWPYLQNSIEPIHKPPVSPSGIIVYTDSQVNLRAEPNTEAAIITMLPVSEALAVLGNGEAEKAKIGQDGMWLQVRTASNQEGYVAAWLVSQHLKDAFPPSGLIVYPIEQVNLRSGPGTTFDVLGSFSYSDPLSVLGDMETAKSRIGKQKQWLQVQAQNGQQGFIAAWLVHITGEAPPRSGMTVFPTTSLNVRVRPTVDANILCIVSPGDSLDVLGDLQSAQSAIGRQDQWLNVRTPTHLTGYVAAWLVSASSQIGHGETSGLRATAADFLNIRAQASTNSPVLSIAAPGETLTIIDPDIESARSRIGQQNQWLYVLRNDGARGWAAAWFLKGA